MPRKVFVQQGGCAKEGVNEFVSQFNRFLAITYTEAHKEEGEHLISKRECGSCGGLYEVYCGVAQEKYQEVNRVKEVRGCNFERKL